MQVNKLHLNCGTEGGYPGGIQRDVRGHEQFIPTKFRKHPLSGSVLKAECVPIHIHALVQPPVV